MKTKTFLLVLMAGSMIASCSWRRSEPITGKLPDTREIHMRTGQVLYMTHCYKCHPGGEGGLGPAINSLHVPAFVKRFQVRHGLGVMPTFKPHEISKEDLKYITEYLHMLHELKPS